MTSILLEKWLRSSQDRLGLDSLLGQAPATTSVLRERLDWIVRLVNWIRTVGPKAAELEAQPGRIQTLRLRHLIQVLDRHPALKLKVAEALRSIIRDTRALELFLNVGVPNQAGFIGECVERLNLHLLPQPPHDKDLVAVFSETFHSADDADWIRQIDAPLFQSLLALFQYSETTVTPGWNTLERDARDALYLLSHSIRSIGLSRLVRNRVNQPDFRNLPFFELTTCTDALLAATDQTTQSAASKALCEVILRCFSTLDEVRAAFREQGASIALVYQIERLESLLHRLDNIGRLLSGSARDSISTQEFLGLLVQENTRARSLKGLFDDNLVLISQKIIEINAEVGEHYITRVRSEHFVTLKNAWGGGALTSLTIVFKFLIHQLSLAPFISGLFAFANYGVSFVGMQLLGWTLATKQPAMTAAALASKIEESETSIEPLVDEVVHLIRSQLTAVIGNITAVVPAVILMDFIFSNWSGHVAGEHEARQTIESFSLLGMTPLYAAWTGMLLWLSSVFAGWFGSWFNYRELPQAIEHQPRLVYVFGKLRAQRLSAFLKHNMVGFAANLSLAFLLGMVPQIATFFGLPLEVRHVTLSSGSLTAAVMTLGTQVLTTWPFWLAVGGVATMAVLNLGVSFALALTVALWAKKAPAPRRGLVYRALLGKILRKPWIFIIPSRVSEEIA